MQRFSKCKHMVHIETNVLERVKNDDDDEDYDAEKPDTQK
jgi:hypothetical protein